MIESLYIAESGLTSQQRMIEVISNNIANSSTVGFKKSHVNFIDLVYQNETQASQSESLATSGAGVMLGQLSTDFSVGELKVTGNDFDISIRGQGFLEVIGSDGQLLYTRAGRLRIDDDGYLTIKSGERLSANIVVPAGAERVIIEEDGRVVADTGAETGDVEVGRIELAKFTNDQNLVSIGGNKYVVEGNTGELIYATPGDMGTGLIAQGVTEISNVSMTEEMVNLMLAQRGYQLNARIIQISDQLLDTINNLRR